MKACTAPQRLVPPFVRQDISFMNRFNGSTGDDFGLAAKAVTLLDFFRGGDLSCSASFGSLKYSIPLSIRVRHLAQVPRVQKAPLDIIFQCMFKQGQADHSLQPFSPSGGLLNESRQIHSYSFSIFIKIWQRCHKSATKANRKKRSRSR